MKSILTAWALVALLSSRQKEISLDANNNGSTGTTGGAGSTSGLLVKTAAVAGSETQTTKYTFYYQ